MAPIGAASSSKLRRPKAFAIRSFPPLCGPASAAAAALPPASRCLTSNRNVPPNNLINPSPEPTSCVPGTDFLSCRRKIIKPPRVFAIRSFPKGCGPAAAAIPKPPLSKEPSAVFARRNRKEEIGLGKITEDAVVGGDLQKPNMTSSQIPNLAQADGGLRGAEDFCSHNEVEEMEEKLNEDVRRITGEANSQGKIEENAVIGKSLGDKNGEKVIRNGLDEKDGEKLVRKSLTNSLKDGRRFSNPASLEPKKELSKAARRITEGGSDSGKIVKKSVNGRSLDEKDRQKADGKRSLKANFVEAGRNQKDQPEDVRHERLVVLALMAAKRCPWMQGKRKGSIGSQSRRTKQKS